MTCPMCGEFYMVPPPPRDKTDVMWHWPTKEWLTADELYAIYKPGETCCQKYGVNIGQTKSNPESKET